MAIERLRRDQAAQAVREKMHRSVAEGGEPLRKLLHREVWRLPQRRIAEEDRRKPTLLQPPGDRQQAWPAHQQSVQH